MLDALVDLDARDVVGIWIPPGGGTVESFEWIGDPPPDPPAD